jgi:hypothetical protein
MASDHPILITDSVASPGVPQIAASRPTLKIATPRSYITRTSVGLEQHGLNIPRCLIARGVPGTESRRSMPSLLPYRG